MNNLDPLFDAWLEAKARESQAQKDRLNIEAQITGALVAKDEGSITHTFDGHKVTLTQPVSRTLDPDKWEKVKHKIPQSFHPTVKTLKADTKGCKWLLENRPDLWNQVAPAFTTKAGKIGVSVKKEESN